MNCPGILDLPRILLRQRKLGRFDGVRELEYEIQTDSQRCNRGHVVGKNQGYRMEQHRNPECQGEEQRLAGKENYHLPPLGPRVALVADASLDHVVKIV